jgi:predicted  nucleic acid-binding Zn-ribbon protein
MSEADRTRQIQAFERDAEMLVVYQLDLLAQLERQLRTVHQMMRHIERLRGAKHRIGAELSNGQRGDELITLSDEIGTVESHINAQRECCTDMQTTIAHMQNLLTELRRAVATHVPRALSTDSPEAES